MSNLIAPCPRCHKSDLVYVNVVLLQSYAEVYDLDGKRLETNEGTYSERRSRNVVRCGACDNVRRDLRYEDGRIVEMKP